jgi:hypothetical protein
MVQGLAPFGSETLDNKGVFDYVWPKLLKKPSNLKTMFF